MIRDFHVAFEADDHVHEDACYGSSIPLKKAMYCFDAYQRKLLCCKMTYIDVRLNWFNR